MTTETTTKRTVILVTERSRRDGRGKVIRNFGERTIRDLVNVDAWGEPMTLGYAICRGRRELVGFNPNEPKSLQIASVLTGSGFAVFSQMYEAARAARS